MKKFLFSCFLALGIGANAQITVNEDWENVTTSLPAGWSASGGYTNSLGLYGDECSNGTQSLGINMFGGTSSGRSFTLIYTLNPPTSNGKEIDYSFKWRTESSGYEGISTGNIQVSYSRASSGTQWTNLGSAISFNDFTNCSNASGTIEESTSATTGVPINSPLRFRIVVTTTSTSPVENDYNWVIEGIKITQKIDTPPSCATVTVPTNSQPNNPQSIIWNNIPGATSYKAFLGTSSGNYDIINNFTTTSTSLSLEGHISANTTYFVKIIPTNANGDASDCQEYSFTTGDLDYCSSVANSSTFNDGITLVNINGETTNINNPSSADAGNNYTDYTTVSDPADLRRGKKYNLNVNVNTDGAYTQYQIAWIDWNQNKTFESNERYDLGSANNVSNEPSSLCPLEITVPDDAVIGTTRMRVISFYNESHTNNPCQTSFDGETEDYAVEVKDFLAVDDINKTNISVYPNPFADVVKISDVKDVKSISINDISGRQVKTLAPASELNLSSLKSGMYIINLNMVDGSVKSIKAIKK